MADSDNITTLPLVTRRRVLGGTAVAMLGWHPRAFANSDLSPDLAIVVWQRWQAAHKQTERLCRRQQRLERKLVETVGFPCATIRLRDGRSATLYSRQAVREVLGLAPEEAVVRAKAEAEFDAHQARWDEADREIGYSTTLREEREAADRAEGLLVLLSKTPAASLAGVAAKLDAVLREGQSSQDDAEFPMPQIRSILDDISRIGRQR